MSFSQIIAGIAAVIAAALFLYVLRLAAEESDRVNRHPSDSDTKKPMNSWNVAQEMGQDERSFTLLNSSRTLVHHSRRVRPDVATLLSKMEELNVPAGYTTGLKEIYFTVLSPITAADYQDCKIRISWEEKTRKVVDKIFVHELGHHVDDMEDISGREEIIEEKRKCSRFLPDSYARRNVSEYVAVGFEIFYCGKPEQKKKMRLKNPRLYKCINSLHRKYGKV